MISGTSSVTGWGFSMTGRGMLVAAVLVFVFAMVMQALAQEPPKPEMAPLCPPGVPACKIIVLTPDEEKTLTGPDMIFDHAVWANRVKFTTAIEAWRRKIESAPHGRAIPAAKPDGK